MHRWIQNIFPCVSVSQYKIGRKKNLSESIFSVFFFFPFLQFYQLAAISLVYYNNKVFDFSMATEGRETEAFREKKEKMSPRSRQGFSLAEEKVKCTDDNPPPPITSLRV